MQASPVKVGADYDGLCAPERLGGLALQVQTPGTHVVDGAFIKACQIVAQAGATTGAQHHSANALPERPSPPGHAPGIFDVQRCSRCANVSLPIHERFPVRIKPSVTYSFGRYRWARHRRIVTGAFTEAKQWI